MIETRRNLRVVLATPHDRHDFLEIKLRQHLGLEVLRVRNESELCSDELVKFLPNYIFFPHWSWKIPAVIYERFECVIFHMTDLPFGRGGSPLQNLIVRGMRETQLTALLCVEDFDSGPIYLKRQMSLLGTAEEILMRASKLTEEMIEKIVKEKPNPYAQVGETTIFSRRSARDGDIASLETLDEVFDYIRMLDADGYPSAFLETKFFRIEFKRASIKSDCIIADVKILRKKP
jgi:methionyl-tRNA formyltransferase